MLAVDAHRMKKLNGITRFDPHDTADAALNASLLLVSTCEDTTRVLSDATVAAMNATRTPSTSIELAPAMPAWPTA
jgi:hypothetical protein